MSAKEGIAERFKRSEMTRNGVNKYRKVEFLKIALIRTENIGGTVEFTKQPKIREEVMIPPKSAGVGKNGRKVVKRLEEAPIKKVKNSNKIVTEIHTKVPKIYYAMMMFGLASAIFGVFAVTSYPIYYSVVFGGISVFLVAFIGRLEIKHTKRKLKITD